MKRWEAWSVHVSTVLVGGTGLVYAWMRYLLPPTDPYAVVNHPLQPAFQHLHVLVAPLLVFAAGLIWSEHIWGHLTSGMPARRRSGIALLVTLVPMAASGYLIQTTVTESWRQAWIVVHLVTSGLWMAGYLVHGAAALVGWWRKRRRRARRAGRATPLREAA